MLTCRDGCDRSIPRIDVGRHGACLDLGRPLQAFANLREIGPLEQSQIGDERVERIVQQLVDIGFERVRAMRAKVR